MLSKTTALASAAALLFAAGAARADHHEGTGGEKIKCEGANACKGQSGCHTAQNECAGHNACKGKGFVMLTPEECKEAKAKIAGELEKDS